MDMINYRLGELEKRADKTDAKLDKLGEKIDTLVGVISDLRGDMKNLQGRVDLIEKKLPNWWQPYAGLGAIATLLTIVLAVAMHLLAH